MPQVKKDYDSLLTEIKTVKKLSDALNEINMTINSTLDFDEIMQHVVVESARAIGSETAVIDMRKDSSWIISYLFGMPEELKGQTFSDEQFVHDKIVASTKKELVVNDAYSFKELNQESVRHYKIRSFLTIPLIIKDRVIGTISFHYHSKPVVFSEHQIDFAKKLATSVAQAIENVNLYKKQLNIADTLQEALLTAPKEIPGLAFGYMYEPATDAAKVGGDFYDLFPLEHGKVGIIIGDVSGKGLEAATLTSLAKNAIKAYAYHENSVVSILKKTNYVVFKEPETSVFVTVFFAILDTRSGAFSYCNAGHPLPIIKRKSSQGIFLTTNLLP